MTQENVERFWSRDRAALVRCQKNLVTVVDYYEDVAERLSRPGE